MKNGTDYELWGGVTMSLKVTFVGLKNFYMRKQVYGCSLKNSDFQMVYSNIFYKNKSQNTILVTNDWKNE